MFSKILCLLLFISTLCYGKAIEVQGHRGCRGVLPENTLPAFMAAIEGGAHTLEMDLHMTKDGIIVIHHDPVIDRSLCTIGYKPIEEKLYISDLTLEEIKKIDCGRTPNSKYPKQTSLPGAKIPTLEEVLTLAKGKNIRLNLELKRGGEGLLSIEEFAKKVVATVMKSGIASRVYYSSFDLNILKAVRKIDPFAKLGIIKSFSLSNIAETGASLRAHIISPRHTLLTTKREVEALQDAGFQVIPWTVNDPKRWAQLIEMGVDGIITDYPQELINFLKRNLNAVRNR